MPSRPYPPPARKPIVIANWKMYVSSHDSIRAITILRKLAGRYAKNMDIVLCPSFPVLQEVRQHASRSQLQLGAQDVHQELTGPHTGDVSVEQLRHLVRYVIVGHSERRRSHGETDAIVAEKARRVLTAGMHPIICVGETAEERDAGKSVQRVREQIGAVLRDLPALDIARIVVAYEPVWAISAGIGEPSTQPQPRDVAEMAGLVRRIAAEFGHRRYVDLVRVVYGGSVDVESVGAFVREPGVDGVLVGSASANPASFTAILREVAAATSEVRKQSSPKRRPARNASRSEAGGSRHTL